MIHFRWFVIAELHDILYQSPFVRTEKTQGRTLERTLFNLDLERWRHELKASSVSSGKTRADIHAHSLSGPPLYLPVDSTYLHITSHPLMMLLCSASLAESADLTAFLRHVIVVPVQRQ